MKKSHLPFLAFACFVLSAALFVAVRPPKALVQKFPTYPPINKIEYDQRMRRLAGLAPLQDVVVSTSTLYPKPGAILPFQRVLAYYGNFRSAQMGILGELSEEALFARLHAEQARWAAADPQTPVKLALHLVAVTAQGYEGKDGKHRLRMPTQDMDRVIAMARKIQGITFLDVQIGKSTAQSEVPMLEKYLQLPDVHLGLDPEFAMKGSSKPGHRIGTMDAAEINSVIEYLSKLVELHHLPPKILIVHRFVPQMLTNASKIRPTPQVQVVIDSDGWGYPDHKRTTYRICVTKDPVQFGGFKLFYKNDLRLKGSRLMTAEEVLTLTPQPIYIQYQ